MKKILLILAVVFSLVVVGVVCLAFFLGSAITAGVNKFGPGVTQTKVTLQSTRVSPIDGEGTLKGLLVGNPQGWSDKPLCSLGEVHVRVEPKSVFSDHIVFHEIRIDAPQINYETKVVSSNVGDLLKNIEAAVGGGRPEDKTDAKAGPPKKFEVRKFTLTNGRVRIGVVGQTVDLPMPPIELTDLGTKEGGVTAAQLAQAVMRSVMNSVLAATAKGAGEISLTSGAAAAESVKKAGEAIKGIFSGAKK